MSGFNDILFKTAVLSMSIDGEVHEEELKFFNSFAKDNAYFEDFAIDVKFDEVICSIKDNLDEFILSLTEDVNESQLNKQYKLIILDVVLAIITSDDKIDHNEVFLLTKLLDIFGLNKSFLLNRYSDLSASLFTDSEIKMDQSSFDQLGDH